MKLVLFALGLAAMAPPALAAEPVKVTTKSGVLVGEQDGAIRRFKGVPYAKPPVGELRWRSPQPTRWEGELKATDFKLPCLQNVPADGRPNGGGVTGASAEDCLYLNVWAPANAKNAPVMLWVYGGGGTMGSGSTRTYDGSAFARDGVILVTINYRLGALAGLSHPALTKGTPANEAHSNYHLLDTIAALQWVKDNATAFGGDPANVTLFGESAGATVTANLVTSPMAKGLFAKAIIESTGSLPTAGTAMPAAEKWGADLATALGLPGADATAAQLRAADAQKIISTPRLGGGLRTIIDGKVKTQSIMDSFTAGTAIDVPMIIGTNSDEGRLSGTQRVANFAMTGAPVWQYFFDYVPDWRRPDQPNGAPHAAEIPYVFDTLSADRTGGSRMTPKDHATAAYIHGCWVAFAKQPASAKEIACPSGFKWPARTEDNGRTTAIFQEKPSLGKALGLRSPPNGAAPGPTSRDSE